VLEFGRNSGIEGEEFQNWLEAVGGVSVRLNRVLERVGLTPISSVGTEVDLAIHDVVATVRNNNYPENTVVEERQKGYYFRGRLLRDAKVVVALSH
jgi:molecular chaperone GrpE